jgi:hypothetical protein
MSKELRMDDLYKGIKKREKKETEENYQYKLCVCSKRLRKVGPQIRCRRILYIYKARGLFAKL